MADETQAPKSETQKAKEYFEGFPEAPFSDSFKWVDPLGFEHLTTVRGWGGQAMYQSVAKMIEFIGETGGKPANPPRQQNAQPQTMAQHMEQSTSADATVHAALEDIGNPPTGKTWQSVDVDKVIITPLAGGKTKAEFWRAGRTYAEETVTWTNEQVTGLMKHVGIDTTKPQEVSKALRVFYTIGKEYTKKNGQQSNYHDVAHVRAVPA